MLAERKTAADEEGKKRRVFVILSSAVCGFYISSVLCVCVRVCALALFVLYGDERVSPPLVTVILLDCVRNYCVIYCTRVACFE